MDKQQKFGQWAIISLFGHKQVAGFVSEASIGTCAFVRVDIPETPGFQAATVYYGEKAIYEIDIVTEESAKAFAVEFRFAPLEEWDLRKLLKKDDWHSRFNAIYDLLVDVANGTDGKNQIDKNVSDAVCEYLDRNPKEDEIHF